MRLKLIDRFTVERSSTPGRNKNAVGELRCARFAPLAFVCFLREKLFRCIKCAGRDAAAQAARDPFLRLTRGMYYACRCQ
jgi:hypothetical protein